MSDVFTKQKRSEVMSRIRGHGNKETEIALLMLFRKHGITGWRRNQTVFGKPDFVFATRRVAVFVDGCFWHLCPKHSNVPVNNRAFWKKKLTANKTRDLAVNKALRQDGWCVVRIWEHELTKHPQRCIQRITRALIVKNDIGKIQTAK